jgi:hypothetical protein
MSKTNKEVMDSLSEYFEKQDFKLICRGLASCLIDFNRIDCMQDLNDEERASLNYRVRKNAEQVRKFAKGSHSEQFIIHNMQSK